MEILNVLKDKVISAVKILEKQEILPSGLNKSLITIENQKMKVLVNFLQM